MNNAVPHKINVQRMAVIFQFRNCALILLFYAVCNFCLAQSCHVWHGLNIMKTALVIAELPKTNDTDEARTRWQDFSMYIQRAGAHPKGTTQITANIWQIPLDNGLPFLGGLFQFAERCKISIRALILDEPPAWIKHPPAGQ